MRVRVLHRTLLTQYLEVHLLLICGRRTRSCPTAVALPAHKALSSAIALELPEMLPPPRPVELRASPTPVLHGGTLLRPLAPHAHHHPLTTLSTIDEEAVHC